MALLRMIAVVAALGACRQTADADPAPARSGLTAPAGWQPLPNLASAITTAAHDGNLAIDGAEAWGETAMGCYAAWFTTSGGSAAADALADQVLASLGTAKLVVADVVKPTAAGGVLSLRFEHAPYRGRLRAELTKGHITAVACFANTREQTACETACTTWLGAMK